jgi:hypothetical protein
VGFVRGVMVALLMEGCALSAVGAVVLPNGAPCVLAMLALGGALAWLLECAE